VPIWREESRLNRARGVRRVCFALFAFIVFVPFVV
jgi:hypothetical protein